MFSDELFKKLNVMDSPSLLHLLYWLPSTDIFLSHIMPIIHYVELQHSLQMFHFDMSALHFYLLIGNKALHG